MAVTLVCDPIADEDYTVNNLMAKGFKIVTGSFDWSVSGGAGVTMSIPLNRCYGCIIQPANGYVYSWMSNTAKAFYVGSVTMTGSGSALSNVPEAMTAVATGTAMATCSALNFFAWGYE
jgi:hypothetical protein